MSEKVIADQVQAVVITNNNILVQCYVHVSSREGGGDFSI